MNAVQPCRRQNQAEENIIEPEFELNRALLAFDQKEFTTAEMCAAAEKTSGYQSVLGAQKIGGLWRIYPAKRTVRAKLFVQGINIRGVRITLQDRNPYVVVNPDGTSQETHLARNAEYEGNHW